MIITTTAIGFISLTIGLTICGLWFLRAFNNAGGLKADKKVGVLIALIFLGTAIQNGVMGFGSLLFATNSERLYLILLANNILLSVAAIIGIYAAFYIFSPKLSPYPVMIVTGILGFVGTILTAITRPHPFLTAENGIDLNLNSQASLIIFYLLLINIGSTFYIFARLYVNAQNRSVKRLSFVICLLAGIGIVNVFIRLVILLNTNATDRTHFFDSGLGLIGLGFILVLLIAPLTKTLIATIKAKISS